MKDKKLLIKRGQLILSEKPFIYVLKSKYRTNRCDFCFSEQKLLKCSGCGYVYYCNGKCQKEAWHIHKTECNCLKKIVPRIVPDAARLLMRLIFKLTLGDGGMEKGYNTTDNYRKYDDLMSHYSEIKNDKKRLEHIETLSVVLRELIGNDLMPNEKELLCMYGRIIINAFNILDDEMNSIGTGVYLGISITDHNCKPNAVVTFEGTTISIRATEDIEELDWSKIFISYIDLLNNTEDRRDYLKTNYYFTCNCLKCNDTKENDEMNAIACPNKNCPEYILKGYENCPKCKTQLPKVLYENYMDILSFTKMHLEQMKDIAYLDVCEIILNKQKLIFHQFNIWHLKVLDLAFDSAIQMQKWDQSLTYGIELLTGFRKYQGDFNPLLGLLYMKIAKIQLLKGFQEEAFCNLHNAIDILKVTHSENHHLFKTYVLPLLMDIQLVF